MARKRIWHVYYGTRGSAGAYIDGLQRAAFRANLDSAAFVSARYRFKTQGVIKIFFPLSDCTERRNFLVKTLRYCELLLGYGIVFFAALFTRPFVNISLIDDLSLTCGFFKALKIFGINVCITCHDVLSHQRGITKRRLSMYKQADRLLVHSAYAHRVLAGIVGQEESGKIIRVPFPSAPFAEILSHKKMARAEEKLADAVGGSGRYFLFIGVVRMSKGIDTLLEAWAACRAGSENKLVIAGKWTDRAALLKKRAAALPNCLLIDHYVNDEEFVLLIENARFVILPYREYSHSAVLYACARCRGAVIISDIEMFADLLAGYELTFPRNESAKLAALIDRAANLGAEQLEVYRKILADAVEESDVELEEEIKNAFQEL